MGHLSRSPDARTRVPTSLVTVAPSPLRSYRHVREEPIRVDITSDRLRKSIGALKAVLSEEPALAEHIDANAEELLSSFQPGLISSCVTKYVEAELDYATAGTRGIGRISDEVPRYGGYFRKQLRALPEDDLREAGTFICEHLVRGYLVRALFTENPPKEPEIDAGEDLFEAWIPRIYAENPSAMSENLRALLSACDAEVYENHKQFLRNWNMKGGGWFSRDKTDAILAYYPLAGFALRIVETGDG